MCPVSVNYWAEGPTDRAAARQLIRAAGAVPGYDYSVRSTSSPGKDFLDSKLGAFNAAARFQPWLVLRDSDSDCAASLAARLKNPAPNMVFRIVVPSIEAWLMADRERFAAHLSIEVTRVPLDPDGLRDAKAEVLRLAKRSQRRQIRDGFAPKPLSGRREGAGYAGLLIEFIDSSWVPETAARCSPSLSRALTRLKCVATP